MLRRRYLKAYPRLRDKSRGRGGRVLVGRVCPPREHAEREGAVLGGIQYIGRFAYTGEAVYAVPAACPDIALGRSHREAYAREEPPAPVGLGDRDAAAYLRVAHGDALRRVRYLKRLVLRRDDVPGGGLRLAQDIAARGDIFEDEGPVPAGDELRAAPGKTRIDIRAVRALGGDEALAAHDDKFRSRQALGGVFVVYLEYGEAGMLVLHRPRVDRLAGRIGGGGVPLAHRDGEALRAHIARGSLRLGHGVCAEGDVLKGDGSPLIRERGQSQPAAREGKFRAGEPLCAALVGLYKAYVIELFVVCEHALVRPDVLLRPLSDADGEAARLIREDIASGSRDLAHIVYAGAEAGKAARAAAVRGRDPVGNVGTRIGIKAETRPGKGPARGGVLLYYSYAAAFLGVFEAERHGDGRADRDGNALRKLVGHDEAVGSRQLPEYIFSVGKAGERERAVIAGHAAAHLGIAGVVERKFRAREPFVKALAVFCYVYAAEEPDVRPVDGDDAAAHGDGGISRHGGGMRAALLVDGEMEMPLVAGVALGYGLGHGIAPRLKTGEAQAAVFVGGLCLCRAGLRGERERDPGERPAVLVALEYLHCALAVSVVEQLDRPVGRDLFDRHMGGGAAATDEVARGSGYLLHIVLAVGQLLEHLHAAYGPEGVDQLVPAAVNAVQLVNAAVDEVFILLPLAVFSEGERADAAVRLVMHVDGRGSAVVLTVSGGDDRHGIVLRFFDNDGDVSVRHITAVGVDGLAEGIGVHALVEVVRPEEERILAPGAHGRGADEARSVIKLELRALADVRAARPVFVYGELGRAADIDPVADDVGRLRAVGEPVKVYPDGEVDVVVALRYDPVAVLDDVYLLSVRLEPEVVAVGGYGVRVEHEAVLHHVENKKLAVPYAAAQAHLR